MQGDEGSAIRVRPRRHLAAPGAIVRLARPSLAYPPRNSVLCRPSRLQQSIARRKCLRPVKPGGPDQGRPQRLFSHRGGAKARRHPVRGMPRGSHVVQRFYLRLLPRPRRSGSNQATRVHHRIPMALQCMFQLPSQRMGGAHSSRRPQPQVLSHPERLARHAPLHRLPHQSFDGKDVRLHVLPRSGGSCRSTQERRRVRVVRFRMLRVPPSRLTRCRSPRLSKEKQK
jgi:hypothetical protein